MSFYEALNTLCLGYFKLSITSLLALFIMFPAFWVILTYPNLVVLTAVNVIWFVVVVANLIIIKNKE